MGTTNKTTAIFSHDKHLKASCKAKNRARTKPISPDPYKSILSIKNTVKKG